MIKYKIMSKIIDELTQQEFDGDVDIICANDNIFIYLAKNVDNVGITHVVDVKLYSKLTGNGIDITIRAIIKDMIEAIKEEIDND